MWQHYSLGLIIFIKIRLSFICRAATLARELIVNVIFGHWDLNAMFAYDAYSVLFYRPTT